MKYHELNVALFSSLYVLISNHIPYHIKYEITFRNFLFSKSVEQTYEFPSVVFTLLE